MKAGHIIAIVALVIAALCWLFRYDVSPVGPARSHVMDRWTGDVYFIQGGTRTLTTPPSSPSYRPSGNFDPSTAKPVIPR